MAKRLIKPATFFVLLAVITAVFALSSGGAAFAAAADGESVYLGGSPLGISAKSDYLIVSEIVNVTTSDGSYSPALQSGIVKGDVIVMVDNKRVADAREFNEAVCAAGDSLVLSVRRGDTISDFVIKPAFDIAQNARKVGLLVKNELNGMGTLTFVSKSGRYGALGHMITDGFGYGDIYSNGSVYGCTVTGFNPATEDKPGELRGSIDYKGTEGSIDRNLFCGIFGNFTADTTNMEEIRLADRREVKSGKAQILTTIDGKEPKLYDIEIIKAVKQETPADKSMVLRVTDRELKKTTGGILQGMSGSPIIQNGKLVGAVTHVFTSDSAKGYGIYVDWMLPNAQ